VKPPRLNFIYEEDVRMTLTNFTMPGFTHFYCSLFRFRHEFRSAEAAGLTYTLYTAIADSCRYKKPDAQIEECGRMEFYDNLKKMERRPYRTEVQLYRAAEAILAELIIDALTKIQLMAVLKLSCMMDDMELRFYKAFDMEIDDPRTVYRECVKRLVPRGDEPGVCMMQDWINLPSA